MEQMGVTCGTALWSGTIRRFRDKMRMRRREKEKKIQGGWSCARLFWQIVDKLELDAKIRVIGLRKKEAKKNSSFVCNVFAACLPKRLCISKSGKSR